MIDLNSFTDSVEFLNKKPLPTEKPPLKAWRLSTKIFP